jgi:hypothetical protein
MFSDMVSFVLFFQVLKCMLGHPALQVLYISKNDRHRSLTNIQTRSPTFPTHCPWSPSTVHIFGRPLPPGPPRE